MKSAILSHWLKGVVLRDHARYAATGYRGNGILNGTETFGDMADALATARTVEPTAGEYRSDGHTHESACLNCATPLVGNHCHACGQAAHVHKTIGAFFHDLLHGVFHFEGKIWRTLPMLVTQPGKLTREYIDGRRASYVSPIALFLFCVFLLFTTINSIGESLGANVNTSVDQALQNERKDLAELELSRKEAVGDPVLRAQIERAITESRDNIAGLEQVKASGISVANIDTSGLETASDVGWINAAIKKAKENPGLALYKIQNYSYKLSWALIPISVPFLWLLFPFSRRFGLYDHTVFVTYSLCFMTLLGIMAMIGNKLALASIGVVVILPPVHMLLQLRGTYGLSWFGAWWRTWFLSMFAFMAMSLFAIVILVEAGG